MVSQLDYAIDLAQVTALIAAKELELEMKGYRSTIVRAAVARARGAALNRAKILSPGIRQQGFVDLLCHELEGTESWCIRVQRGGESQ